MPELNLILDCIALAILLPLLLREIVFAYFGREEIVLQLDEMTDFSVVERTPERLVIAATLPVVNEGKQCGTIMDAILRVQLPYEQYDGALVRGKVELEGAPRADDYFEAVLIQKKERINLVLKLSIEPRGGRALEDAIAHLVDFRSDLIYQETGRTPVHYEKAIIMMGADEIAALAGVTLLQEGGAQHG
ncbi:hypothetical protein HMPREF9162_2084 [Selenomonas sp. oral taxon 137 str. F0430]|uniref:hypothetical protein n=1 Tax=Selenomonas sp. oral taxon 137 TaxID=712531 RepID=UPI0001EB1E91|nr:hypothetical protein [Selenomonas sp. oral taxon 137]EFR40760.1 hypothetical protein HMPREF9162_2084 [Selenomonas sp. oral taxon 137 str. F0430]